MSNESINYIQNDQLNDCHCVYFKERKKTGNVWGLNGFNKRNVTN